MKLLILRSVRTDAVKDAYSVSMDTLYAERVIGHLTDMGNYCRACQKNCITCRKDYNLNYSGSIAGILNFPAVVPVMIDDPNEYLTFDVPPHDILLSIGVNEEILFAFLKKFFCSRGVIVPQERSDWISPNYVMKIAKFCRDHNIESSFPKPFCAFDPSGGILKKFREEFRIGKAKVEYSIKHGVINEARVLCSAPCGATYHTCRGLKGRGVDENLQFIIDNRLSAYPCTADHAVDREFNDSITHQAVKIQRDILPSFN